MMDHSETGGLEVTPAEEHERLGQRLRDAREYVGLSQESVAAHLGIPRASVSALEAGKRKVSGLELRELARLYRQPVGQLLDDGSDPELSRADDETFRALFREARRLTETDRRQVVRFAQFLREAGPAPASQGAGSDGA